MGCCVWSTGEQIPRSAGVVCLGLPVRQLAGRQAAWEAQQAALTAPEAEQAKMLTMKTHENPSLCHLCCRGSLCMGGGYCQTHCSFSGFWVLIYSSHRGSTLSVPSSFFIWWFVCRPESREGECPAHGWPCRFPDLQAVEKIKPLEKKALELKKKATAFKQCSGEPATLVLTLRNILFNFLTAEVNLVDGAHGSWRMKKTQRCWHKGIVMRKSPAHSAPVWHCRAASKICDLSIISTSPNASNVFFYLRASRQVKFTTPKIGTMSTSKFSY